MKRYIKADIVDVVDESADTRAELAKSTRSVHVMQQLFQDKSFRVRKCLLENPNLPEDMYNFLIKNNFLVGLAVNDPETSPETLRKIFNEYSRQGKTYGVSGRQVMEYFANNSNTPSDVLRDLASHPSIIIRKYVAMNPNLPSDLMLKFANHTDKDIRSSVAFNPSVTPDILRKMSDDPEDEVRSAVASNTNTPTDVLQKLYTDSDHGTSFCARCTLKTLGVL